MYLHGFPRGSAVKSSPAKQESQQDGRRGEITFRIKPIPTRDTQRAQTNLVCTRTQRSHRDWDRTVFECLLWRYGSAVACHRGRGSECSYLVTQPVAKALLNEVAINLTTEPPSRQPTNWRTIMPKKFSHCKESSRTHNRFPTWGSGKGTENSQRIWLWRPVRFDYRTYTGLGKQTLGGHKQNYAIMHININFTSRKGEKNQKETRNIWKPRHF